jgi:tetratricopeptide (TPR) repeat protein
MSRRALAITLAAVLIGLIALLWRERPREPRVIAEGEPLPYDEQVELPEPDPSAADREPSESARALDASALEEWKHGDVAKALALFEQAVAADPDDAVPRSHLGRLLTLMTDYAAALPHLERAAALRPDDPQVWLDLQTLYERSQRLDGAFQARERADRLAEGRPIVQDEQGFYRLADTPPIP